MAAHTVWLRRFWAVGGGLAWAQIAILLQGLVLPRYLPLSASGTRDFWYPVASWTLLAPLSLASPVTFAGQGAGGRPVTALELPAWRLALSLGIGVGLCLFVLWLLGCQRWRNAALCGLTLFVALSATSAAAVTLRLRDATQAEVAFFAMLSGVDVAHRDAATVAGSRDFARRYPDSRWAGEALRIVAMAEWDAGRIEAAAQSWAAFESRFRDRSAPGVAYAHYSLALCDERLGKELSARRHLRTAIETIRVRGDGMQSWIATDAAKSLASLEEAAGRYVMAGYWNTKSQTFANVYSTE